MHALLACLRRKTLVIPLVLVWGERALLVPVLGTQGNCAVVSLERLAI